MTSENAGADAAKAMTAVKPLRPRDASTLIIVDRTGNDPRVLMGKRRMEQVFMPGKYVFPGGRVDKSDRIVESADELSDVEAAKLMLDMKGSVTTRRARALALAAIRETYEEAGIVVGKVLATQRLAPVAGWTTFFSHGYAPTVGPLSLFARAITPPGRPRRYDTRFFCMDATAIAHRTDVTDGELSGLHWMTVEEARNLDLPAITRVILEDLKDHLRLSDGEAANASIPYYHHKNGSFRRDILTLTQAEP
jgi:8-oxo-dGTP pyrophosphatase MutT (NUDIX family)